MAQSKLPEDLEQRLLALAPAERLALATRLLASVEGPDPDRDEAWSAELDGRDAQFDSGGVVGIPAAEVHASVRTRLRARSSKP
jgi:putative addiction module component (TIGR02574 family)